jgi:hypothetical protein
MKYIRDFYRGFNDFKKGYQPRNNMVKDKRGDLVTGYYSILDRWRNHIAQLKNANGVNHLAPEFYI